MYVLCVTYSQRQDSTSGSLSHSSPPSTFSIYFISILLTTLYPPHKNQVYNKTVSESLNKSRILTTSFINIKTSSYPTNQRNIHNTQSLNLHPFFPYAHSQRQVNKKEKPHIKSTQPPLSVLHSALTNSIIRKGHYGNPLMVSNLSFSFVFFFV